MIDEQLESSGAERLAMAVVRQAYRDLASACRKLRQEAVEFFCTPSPWLSILKIHSDFAKRRLAAVLDRAAADRRCHKLVTRKKLEPGYRVCPKCNTIYENDHDDR